MAKRHELSKIWGDIEAPQLAELAADIKAHGLKEPVVMYKGEIVDGWNRANACRIAGIKAVVRQFDPATDGELVDFVIQRNAMRRHQTPAMRAAGMFRAEEYRSAHCALLCPNLMQAST